MAEGVIRGKRVSRGIDRPGHGPKIHISPVQQTASGSQSIQAEAEGALAGVDQ